MKAGKKIISCMLISALVVTTSFNGDVSVLAEEENGKNVTEASEKEEVVYAILNADGTVSGIYVVNSFRGGKITDYGDYKNIKNLTSTDEINYSGDKVTFNTQEEKIYYQGDLTTKDIPWNVEVHYYIDGEEYSASQIAGKSGKLQIDISITENKACDSSFWKGYALQATLTLDGDRCSNIIAENATIANVGADKQLSYIILPGKETKLTITADVKDFEMDEISVNGMKLNLDFDFDDGELTDKIDEVKDAVGELNSGAKDLNSGAGELKDGADGIYDGAKDMESGAKELDSGVEELNNGIKKIQKGLKTIDGKSDTLTKGSKQTLNALKTIQTSLKDVSLDVSNLTTLSEASTQIKTGINSLVSGLKTIDDSIDIYNDTLAKSGISDINTYVQQHNQAIAALNITDTQRTLYSAYESQGTQGVITKLSELVKQGEKEATDLYREYASTGNTEVITNYVTEAGTLINIEKLLKGDISYIEGSSQLISGIDSTLNSETGDLMKGALNLQSNYAKFDKNIQSMVTSLSSLAVNMSKLKTGIDQLTTSYGKLNKGITSYTNAVSKIVKGYGAVYKGALTLASGTSKLYQGTSDLVDGTLEMCNGTQELKDGTEELVEGTGEFENKTSDIDTEVSDMIDDTIDELTGKNVEIKSFVSDKNTNVDSVLFVLKIPAIEKAEEEEKEEENSKEESIWDRFLNIFS